MPREPIEIVESTGVTWRFDTEFLLSNWECRWGNGCVGILDVAAPELGQGCCSVGAELLDDDEARLIAALAASLDPDRFQYHGAEAYFDDDHRRTAVVDGACVFLNRPGFAGGHGCALHLASLDDGESPIDGKPSVCWQLPLRVERSGDVAEVRAWRRSDWGPGGDTMAWCCTERPDATAGDAPTAFVGARPVIESLADELDALLGPDLFALLQARLGPTA